MEQLSNICQWVVMIMGAVTIWFLAQKKPWMRWGYVIGLLSEPFWMITTYYSKQYGIMVLTLIYGFCYALGIRNYFLRKK